MNKRFDRVIAIAEKEWRLNLRFPLEFLMGHFFNPLKSAVLMCVLYSGFFRNSSAYLGSLSGDNYVVYVLLGSILHSQFTCSIAVFRGKMVSEKYWHTVTATLLTPASIFEVVGGYALGSGGATLFANAVILTGIAFFYSIQLKLYLFSLVVLLLVSILGFSIGLIGAMIGLCWEGHSFIFDHGTQAVTFLSCFYYPLELLPKFVQPIIKIMPTYQLSNALHELYISHSVSHLPFVIGYMVLVCLMILIPSGILFEKSVRKYGIVGY